MAIKYRGYKYSWQFFKNAVGSSNQIPAAGITVVCFKQGARINGTITGSAGAQTIPVYDPGSVQVGDTIFIDIASGTTATVGTVTATTIVTNAGALLASSGTRVVIGSATLTGYVDDQLGTSAGVLVTGASGAAEAYFHEPVLDCYITGTGITTQILSDYAGSGIWPEIDYFGIKADNSNADTQALKGAIGRAIAKGQQEIQLPTGTIIIDAALTVTGAVGLRIKGKGRGLTKLKLTNDSLNLFIIGSGTEDFILEDLELSGSGAARTVPLVIETSSNTTGTSLRRAKLVDGGEGIRLLGTDGMVDDVLFSGTRWAYPLRINGATRPHVRDFRGRFGAAATNGIYVEGLTSGVSIENVDIGSTSGSTPGITLSGTGVDTRVTNCRFSGGAAAPAVIVGAGNTTILTNVIGTGSLYGFLLSGGTNTVLNGCQASLNQGPGYSLSGTPSHVTMSGCKSSDANQAGGTSAHCEIAGTISDVHIWDFEVGRFTGGTTLASSGVLISDGAGLRVTVGNVYGENSGISGNFISNLKTNARVGIYVTGHGVATDSTTTQTPDHVGFAMTRRTFLTGAALNIDGVNHVNVQYAAPENVTDLQGGTTGQFLFVSNTGASTVTFVHNVAKIICANTANFALLVNKTAVFFKPDPNTVPWYQMVVGTAPVVF